MIPVFQTQFGYGKGSCHLACIASIFECEEADLKLYDFLAMDEEDTAKWTECCRPELEFHSEDLGYDFELVDASPAWGGDPQRWTYKVRETYEPPPVEFWIASIFSPAVKRPMADPYYPMPALHAVVMRGNQIAHDPNPAYDTVGHIPRVVMKSWWEPRGGRTLP